MGDKKSKVTNLWDKYVEWLYHLSTYIDTPLKARNLILQNGKKIILWFYIITTLMVMLQVYNQGECMNCTSLSEEQAEYLVNNEGAITDYVGGKVYGDFTSVKSYLSYIIGPLLIMWIKNLFFISLLIIIFNIMKKGLRWMDNRNKPIIKKPKINRNEQS